MRFGREHAVVGSMRETDPRAARRVLDSEIDRHATLKEVSLAYVAYVVACLGGNKVLTARAIGIDRRTIQRWFKSAR